MKSEKSDYNKLDHKLEIILTPDANVQLLCEDDPEIPRLTFNFKLILEINNSEEGFLIGIIKINVKKM